MYLLSFGSTIHTIPISHHTLPNELPNYLNQAKKYKNPSQAASSSRPVQEAHISNQLNNKDEE